MGTEPTNGMRRLRKSGVGVIGGGVLLAILVMFVPFWMAALAISLIGLGGILYGKRLEATQGALGVLAVGAIAFLEAIPGVGLGIEPLFLAGITVVFGAFDVLAGVLLGRMRGKG